MKHLLILLLGVYSCSGTLLERPCGSDLSNLWLDVVTVVDVSNGMTTESLDSVAATLTSVFTNGTKIGTVPSNPRTTRVGLVTYSQNATVKADLDTFKSVKDFTEGLFKDLSTTENGKSYLVTGLEAAEQMFGDTIGTSRGHYRKVIIVFTSAYEGAVEVDPAPLAARLQASGITIITVAYSQTADVLNGLSKVATPPLNFTNEPAVIGDIKTALLQANCYCIRLWEPFRDQFSNPYSFKYGGCLLPVNVATNWKFGNYSCRNHLKGAYLVNEYSQKKHDFVLDLVKAAGFIIPYQYHIGLSYNGDQWVWEQPDGSNQTVDSDWFNWYQGYPVPPSSASGVMNSQTGITTRWMNVPTSTAIANYVCEVASCDTDNYCGADKE